ncbi:MULTISPECIES: hypothetical protein [unclassified Janthinobacterium]|nr:MULTISPECIES: hypothetical protein [unclassified Janthinobacterium]MDN2671145.1 hypothetical protein [Janthinobacterium sp. SUN026]MDN2675346.1 hypothetical protein [Janthinobacterium sp. SUN033]MDO8037513.1 hypothetical protein [Janthinobacterium sp. SUN137]
MQQLNLHIMFQHIGVITRVKGVAVTQHKLANSIIKINKGGSADTGQGMKTDWRGQAAGPGNSMDQRNQRAITSIIHQKGALHQKTRINKLMHSRDWRRRAR